MPRSQALLDLGGCDACCEYRAITSVANQVPKHWVLCQVRAGEVVSQYEIMRFAQLFNDELTLDNLERIHLVNLCRFVGIQPFGTDAFLVSRLRTHLAAIKVLCVLWLEGCSGSAAPGAAVLFGANRLRRGASGAGG